MDEKREDHPLWPAFVKRTGGCNTCRAAWEHFLAGTEAVKDARTRTPQEKLTAVADRLSRAVERLEELRKQQCDSLDRLESLEGQAAKRSVRISAVLNRLEDLAQPSETINAKLDKLQETMDGGLEIDFTCDAKPTG